MSVSWPVVSNPSQEALTNKQLTDYQPYKASFINWLQSMGKDPKHVDGYADETVRQTHYRVDKFYRWLWDENDGYTRSFTDADANGFTKHLICDESDYSNNYLSSSQKALKRLFKWHRHERGQSDDFEWDSDFSFSASATNTRDYFTVDERRNLREAALEYGSVPHYTALSPNERDKWKRHLSYRFNKPKRDIGLDDFERANGWKITSLIWTALDTGLRLIEVGRATVQWVDVENKVLRIPKEESSKNTDNWIVSITDRTAASLDRWLREREHYEKYDDTDSLWLTRTATPYSSNSLRHVVSKLCEIADINTENRQLTFYSIRHSVGTFMARERGLKAAQSQLRHKSPETTMRYDQAPVTDRRDALNKMG